MPTYFVTIIEIMALQFLFCKKPTVLNIIIVIYYFY